MRQLIVLLGAAPLLLCCDSPTDPEGANVFATFSKSYGGEGNDEVFAVAATADRLWLAGGWDMDRLGSEGADGDLWVAALDTAGNLAWTRAIGTRNLADPGEDLPILRAVAADEGGAWLTGTGTSRKATVVRADGEGNATWTVEIDPHKPERFEVGWSIAPVDGGAVVAIWADDVVLESVSDGHPLTDDVKHFHVPRWRVRVARIGEDGRVVWTRTLDAVHRDPLPQGLEVSATYAGGAVVAVSLENTLQITRLAPDGGIEWTIERSGHEDVRGLFAMPHDAVALYGEVGGISLDGRRGFVMRLDEQAEVVWRHERSDFDTMTAGALICQPNQFCELAFGGVGDARFNERSADLVILDLVGQTIDERRDFSFGTPRAIGYDALNDRLMVDDRDFKRPAHSSNLT